MTLPEPGLRSPPAWRGIGGLDLEDLLDELRSRASVARRSQERMSDLLDAVVAVSADLDLPDVLSRIVASATSLVDARYGALGVLSTDQEHLVEFITDGVSPQVRAKIGDPPRGHGILGLLIRDPEPRRLADISTHPASFGFPPNHPPMHTFLGVPIRIRDEVYGNLYMADKHGGGEFTAEDEAVLVALAAAAGVAIDNARLYDLGRRQQEWIEAVGEVAQMLLEREDEVAATTLMAEHARRLSTGSCAILALADETNTLIVHDVCHEGATAVGRGAAGAYAGVAFAGVHWAQARRLLNPGLLRPPSASPPTSAEEGDGVQLREEVCRVAEVSADSLIAVLPLSPGRGDLGVLVITWAAPAETEAEEAMSALTDYAQQAGLALLAGRAHRDRARMVLAVDRDRIARDMHDHVIQRLFATGLSLQAAGRITDHPTVRSRLDEAVDDLDAAIKEIRHTIYQLHEPVAARSADDELLSLVASFADGLGFEPEMALEGSLSVLAASLRSDVLAVVREGLSNVTRHAASGRAGVAVDVGRFVTVEVFDDGVGVDADQASSGLVNLHERAVAASGDFAIGAVEPTGTRLVWRAPVVPG
ncbi:MAG: GAF domain-containing protein [Lapillicoccus sp.]